MLKQIKTKILSLIFSRGFKRSLFFGGIVFIIMHFWFDTVFAGGPELEGDTKSAVTSLINVIQYIVWASAAILWVLTWLISVLLDPWFTNGSNFGISWYIKQVWVFVSNMVYFIFAWLLIFISFANIIWKTEDLFNLKKSLPKFIIWVLIVPFSWFIVTFTISLSSVLMVSVFSWPIETFTENTELKTYLTTTKIDKWCPAWTINIQWSTSSSTTTTSTTPTWSWFITCSWEPATKTLMEILNLQDWTDWTQNIWWLLAVYTYWIMDIESTAKLYETQTITLSTLEKLSAKVVFDIIFILVYMLILVALFIVLFIRFIMLWIYMMISPLFWLMFFLQKWKMWAEMEKFSFKEFFALAMVPVYVSFALSFWMMFVFIMAKWFSDPTTGGVIKDWVIKLWSTTINITWEVGGAATGFFKDSMWVLGLLMLRMFSLAVLWISVMTALKQAEITKKIIEPIDKFWRDVWQTAMNSYKYIPIPGTSGISWTSKNATIWWLSWWMSRVVQGIKNKSTMEADSFYNHNMASPETKAILKKLDATKIDDLKDFLKTDLSLGELVNNQSILNGVATKLQNSWVPADQINELRNSRSDQTRVLKALEEINKDEKTGWKITWNKNDTIAQIQSSIGSGKNSSATIDDKVSPTTKNPPLTPNNIKSNNVELTDNHWAISDWKWRELADYLVDKLWDKLEKMKYWESGFRELFSWLPADEQGLITQLKSRKVLNDDWTFNDNYKHDSWNQKSWTSSSSEPSATTQAPSSTWWNSPSQPWTP